MKRYLTSIVLIFLLIPFCLTEGGDYKSQKDRGKGNGYSPKLESISDRSYNIIDVNLLGVYVGNMGQFYTSWNETADPEGEWPLGSGHSQMYRMNMFVGVPGNVVQTRAYGEKEWDPVFGYNNPDEFLPVSNDTTTWPLDNLGTKYWPVRDADDNPVIISEQDSYGVYRDSTNYLYLTTSDPSYMLNIVVHQTSYAWNTALDKDYIVFKFDLVNEDTQPHDSVYFCMYTDFDCGGFDDYTDDQIGFELSRQFYYFYDSDNWSPEWNAPAFHFGLVYLQTPETIDLTTGITDFHFTEYYDEPTSITDDEVLFNYMSSDPSLRADSLNWSNLFHGNDLHYDDPAWIPAGGMDLVCFPSSGPYYMAPGDTLTFITALVAGSDYDDISVNVDRIWEIFESGWEVKSVPQPVVTAEVGDRIVTLEWSTIIDQTYIDPYTGTNTLMGYYIYKTEDPNRLVWGAPIDSLMAGENLDPDYYSWSDMDVLNGFYYSYAVTAFDSSGDESGIANVMDNINTIEIRPASNSSSNMGNIKVVPNPYVVSAAWERERLGNIIDGEPVRELSFINLPPQCTIKIFTLDGDLVKTLNHSNGTGSEYWDIRSDYNQMVSTGIYFYYVKWSDGDHLDKFAVIR